MVDRIFYFITVPMVYAAFAWCIIGCIGRIASIARAPRHPSTLKIFGDGRSPSAGLLAPLTMPTIFRHKPLLWFFAMVFHLGIAVLIVSHLDLFPQISIMDPDSEHMIGAGAVGVALTISVLYLLFRRFRSPVRELSVPGDYLLLFLLFLIVATGDIISWGNSWGPDGFVITKQDFGTYLDSLVHFTWQNPSQILYGSHYYVVGVHILLANLFLIFLPFSKVVHTFFALPLNRLRRG